MSKFSLRSFHFPGDRGEILWGEKILKVEKNHKKFPLGEATQVTKSEVKEKISNQCSSTPWQNFWSALAVHFLPHFFSKQFLNSAVSSTETNEQNWMSSEFSFADKKWVGKVLSHKLMFLEDKLTNLQNKPNRQFWIGFIHSFNTRSPSTLTAKL